MKRGDRVRMSAALKAKFIGQCIGGVHVGLFTPMGDEDMCMGCSTAHVEEFGECEGVVLGPTDYNNCKPGEAGYDEAKVGPEVDVSWQPSRLRYAYHPDDLEVL